MRASCRWKSLAEQSPSQELLGPPSKFRLSGESSSGPWGRCSSKDLERSFPTTPVAGDTVCGRRQLTASSSGHDPIDWLAETFQTSPCSSRWTLGSRSYDPKTVLFSTSPGLSFYDLPSCRKITQKVFFFQVSSKKNDDWGYPAPT